MIFAYFSSIGKVRRKNKKIILIRCHRCFIELFKGPTSQYDT